MDFKQADFFEQACTAVVLSSLRIFDKVETFGKRFYIDPENRTRVSPEFFIRFTDGSTVMLTWYDPSNELHVSVAFDGGIKADAAFDMPYENTIASASIADMRECLLVSRPLGTATWCGELQDSILVILSYAEADKLAELFNKNGTDNNGVKYVNRNPNAELE
jgi:hypothetical protein